MVSGQLLRPMWVCRHDPATRLGLPFVLRLRRHTVVAREERPADFDVISPLLGFRPHLIPRRQHTPGFLYQLLQTVQMLAPRRQLLTE